MSKTIILSIISKCARLNELPDKQVRYVYQLLADDWASNEVKISCLFQWSHTTVIGRPDNGTYLLKHGNFSIEVTLTFADYCRITTYSLPWRERPRTVEDIPTIGS